jgi:hypothetical protein
VHALTEGDEVSGFAMGLSNLGGFGAGDELDMLQLQQHMAQQEQMHTLMSNIMKMQRDSATNVIRNLR